MLHLGRSNRYDGVLEYWVIVKEAAEHTESLTQEEIHRQKKKAGHPGNQTSQSNMSHLPRRWMILPCRRWTRQASRSWRIRSVETMLQLKQKVPTGLQLKWRLLGYFPTAFFIHFSGCIYIYIYRSINLILKMIAFGFFFTRVSELHQNMLSGPCAATGCLEALH